MSHLPALVAEIRRPSILLRAARFALSDYRRDRDLVRLIGPIRTAEAAVSDLYDQEQKLESTRIEGTASYSLSRHIEVLTALLAEVTLLQPDVR